LNSFTAKDAEAAKERKSLTAKDAKSAKEQKSLTAKDAKEIIFGNPPLPRIEVPIGHRATRCDRTRRKT